MPAEFAVRIASLNDEQQVSAVLDASYSTLMRTSYNKRVLAAALPIMTAANVTLLSSGNYFVAESRIGHIVGCGGWSVDRPGNGEVKAELAHIRHFAVHPDWVRHGIGRAIYKRCEAQARRLGMQRFECYASLNAETFYCALRFKKVRTIEIPISSTLMMPSLLMERLI